jgi:hypothetical protein
MDHALRLNVPIDISAAPALFGNSLVEPKDAILIQNSSRDLERATDSKHAGDLVQAHLIETLSAIGRPYIDFYFVRSRKAYEEAQISGIMEALESARQEGHVQFFGLYVESFPASIANWQFHDAFEVVSIPSARRAGLITRVEDSNPRTHGSGTVLFSVKAVSDLQQMEAA